MRHRIFFRAAVLAALVLAAGMSATLQAETKVSSVPLEKLVPKSTLAYMTLPNLTSVQEAIKKCAFYGLWKNENLRKALPIVFSSVDKGLKMVDETLAKAGVEFKVADLQHIFGGQVSIALTEIAAGDFPMPKIILQVDITAEETKALNAINIGLGLMKEEAGEMINVTTADRNGKPLITIAPAQAPFKICIGFTAGSMFISNDEAGFKALLDAADIGGADGSLATDEIYNLVKAKVLAEGTPLSFAYIDTEKVIKLLLSFAENMIPAGEMAKAKKVFDIFFKLTKRLGWGSALVDDLFVEYVFSYAPGGAKFPGMTGSALAYKTAAFSPSDTLFYMAATWNPKEMVDWFIELVSQVEPGAPEQIKAFREDIKSNIGFDIYDVIATISGEMAFFVAPPAGGGIVPGGAICVELKDKAKWKEYVDKALAFLENLATSQGGQLEQLIEQTKLENGETMYTFPIISQQMPAEVPIDIACGVVGDFFVIATTPQLLKGMSSIPSEKSLAGSASFTEAKKHFLVGAGSAGFIDLSLISGILYDLGLKGIRGMGSSIEGVNPAAMPQPDEVSGYFKPIWFSSSYTNDGALSKTVSNIGPAGMYMLALPVMGAIAIPAAIGAQSGSRSAASEAAVIANLRALSSVQEMYRVQYNKYGTLQQLGDEGYIDPRLAEGELYGYRFIVRLIGDSQWEGVAVPVMGGQNKRGFFVDETGILRFTPDGSTPNRKSPVLK